MKIFKGVMDKKDWGSKFNFVDENNVYVGFDSESSCYEDFGYILSKEPPTVTGQENIEFKQEDYIFDTEFFEEDFKPIEETYWNEDNNAVMFKMVNRNDVTDIVYLTLYNCHNGYYSHGFDMKIDGVIKHEGSL